MSGTEHESILLSWLPSLKELAETLATEAAGEEDLYQEGCLTVTEYLSSVTAPEEIDRETAFWHARERMEQVVQEAEGYLHTDERLVAQVELLNASIDRLTKEFGDKPTIDEIANDLGVSQDTVLQIIRLTGEELEEEHDHIHHEEEEEPDHE